MVDLAWCKKQNKGVELVKPNENISKSYLEMAEKTMSELVAVKTNIWKPTQRL
jgi:hypothetical protein